LCAIEVKQGTVLQETIFCILYAADDKTEYESPFFVLSVHLPFMCYTPFGTFGEKSVSKPKTAMAIIQSFVRVRGDDRILENKGLTQKCQILTQYTGYIQK